MQVHKTNLGSIRSNINNVVTANIHRNITDGRMSLIAINRILIDNNKGKTMLLLATNQKVKLH
jgi:hypothetical protein